ncbi:MAG: DinB family protein [Chitinophagales bacterium]
MLQRKFHIESGIGKHQTVDYLLGILYDARVTTFRYIQDINQHELDWQPYPGWNTVGALLQHIIACDYFFNAYFIENRKLTAEEEKDLMPALDLGEHVSQLKGKPVDFYSTALMQSHKALTNSIKQLSAEQLFEKRFDVYDKENGSNLAWILYHKAEDEVHHRGQISLLRKLYKQVKEEVK